MAWHVLASTRVTNRRNVVLFGERRLLVMVRRKLFFKCYFSKDMKSTATVRLPLHLRDLVTVHSCCVNLCFQETRRTYGFSVSFKSVDEVLWCHLSNESSLVALSHGSMYFLSSNRF